MSENEELRLTKTKIKSELRRRMEWFEKGYGFNEDTCRTEFIDRASYTAIAFGRYCALKEMLYQIENGLFIGGFAC